ALARRAISGLAAESDSDDWARKDEEKRAAAESSRRRRTRVILSFHSIMSLASVAQPFRQASPQLVNLLSLKSPDCTCVSITAPASSKTRMGADVARCHLGRNF